VSTAFFVVSIVGLALTVNALHPLTLTAFSVPSFFAAWMTKELAPHNLVIHVGATAAFLAAGALDGSLGWIGLACAAVSAGGLLWLIAEAHAAREVVETALCDALGIDYATRILPHRSASYDLRVPWRQLLLPFSMRHPDVERIKNVPYGDVRRRNLLDVYRHKSRPAGCPTLLQIHGGAWVISNKNQQGKPTMLHLASRGWVCFAPNYRLSPRATWPDHMVDIKRAIAWIREHGAEYGADPGFIVITGGSAGGHLSALAALTPNDPEFQPGFQEADTTVQAAIPYYGVYDIPDELGTPLGRQRLKFFARTVMKRRFSEDPESFRRASPLARVNPDTPPFFVIHGAHDSLVPAAEAREFVRRLRAVSKSPVVYADLPGTQHAFDVFPSIRTAHVIRAAERFADFVYTTYLAARDRERETLG
jgi:acetyl esterase/lipase